MPPHPAPSPSEWDDEPTPPPDWMTEEEWLAQCAASTDEEPPQFEDDYWDPATWDPDEIAAVVAESDQAADDEAASAVLIASLGQTAAMAAASAGRRGPGQEGSARPIPGVCDGPGGGFATAQVLDTARGGGVLLTCAERAAGDDDRFAGTSDDELAGIIAATDRCEATASSLKLAAVAELIRRRPASGCRPEGDREMPADWDEFAERELASLLAASPRAMEGLLELAHDLEVKLPGTKALLRSGLITQAKAQSIAAACAPLAPDEARAAEAIVLGRAPRLTPAGLRSAIARAVMEVNAAKAKKRREEARKQARVELWPEPSGNAAIEARELPVAEAEAIDQRISWWAEQLKESGIEGSKDQLRALAFADLLLARDSRPGAPGPLPAGFAGRVNLTATVATLLGLADRPGELGAVGPIDPWLARDLAAAAARNPKTTWCVTVTDPEGHAIGHGCARPAPKDSAPKTTAPRSSFRNRRTPGPAPPGSTGFGFTPKDRRGPPGGYGTWRLRTPGGGHDLIVALDPLTTENCDHRFEAPGHDPGVKLRHLTQIRYARCTGPACRRPAAGCDYEHNVPYEAGGRTCLCNGGPKCRHDHRLKQHPRWNVEQFPDGTFRWTTPSGRQCTTEPTRYPI